MGDQHGRDGLGQPVRAVQGDAVLTEQERLEAQLDTDA